MRMLTGTNEMNGTANLTASIKNGAVVAHVRRSSLNGLVIVLVMLFFLIRYIRKVCSWLDLPSMGELAAVCC